MKVATRRCLPRPSTRSIYSSCTPANTTSRFTARRFSARSLSNQRYEPSSQIHTHSTFATSSRPNTQNHNNNNTAQKPFSPKRPLILRPPSDRVFDLSNNIIYSAKDQFLILNKPGGLSVQDIAQYLPKTERFELTTYKPHRLDKHVCGVLVLALNKVTATLLSRDLGRGLWLKQYRVICDVPPCFKNQPSHAPTSKTCCLTAPTLISNPLIDFSGSAPALKPQGRVMSSLGVRDDPKFLRRNNPRPDVVTPKTRQRKCSACANSPYEQQPWPHPLFNPILMSSANSIDNFKSRLAITDVELINHRADLGRAAFKATLVTGRKHQARVHFSELGLPIVHDPYYSPHFIKDTYLHIRHERELEAYPLGLQAYKLSLLHPYKNVRLTITLPYPEEWKSMFPAFVDTELTAPRVEEEPGETETQQ